MAPPDSHRALPVVLRNSLGVKLILYTGLSPSLANHSGLFYYLFYYHVRLLQPQINASIVLVWAITVSLAATQVISLISFPHPTKMFQFGWFPSPQLFFNRSRKFYCRIIPIDRDWVSPFGHRRIKGFWLLPDDFRGLIRPSSVLHAKAFTVCVNIRLKRFGKVDLNYFTATTQFKTVSFELGCNKLLKPKILDILWGLK